jgi:hypothetical protein
MFNLLSVIAQLIGAVILAVFAVVTITVAGAGLLLLIGVGIVIAFIIAFIMGMFLV